MSLSRSQLAAALWGSLQRQFTEVGITNVDDTGHLKEPVDQTLLALGVSYGELATGTVADGKEHQALTVARYYGLRAVYDAALGRVDMSVSAPGVSKSSNQYVKDLAAALKVAEEQASVYLPDTGSWGFGVIPQDSLEPYPSEHTG